VVVPCRTDSAARGELDLEVEMGVDVEQAGHQPATGGVDGALGVGWVEGRAARGDAAVSHGHVFLARRRAGAVEDQGVAEKGLPGTAHDRRVTNGGHGNSRLKHTKPV